MLLETNNDLPLLAETHYGLGKTMAFLSDAKNRWAADWLTWPGYAKFWGQLVRDCVRRADRGGIQWSVSRDGGNAVVQLSALGENGSRNDLVPQIRVTSPRGCVPARCWIKSRSADIARKSRWAKSARSHGNSSCCPVPESTLADVARTGSRRLFYAYSDEYRTLPVDVPLLRALSDQTGGVFAPRAEDIFRARADGGASNMPLWRHCAALALLLFLLDILVRRARWRWRRGPAPK